MSKINQCIKTGANVLLTAEGIVVHGDLHFIAGDNDCQTLVLNYVLPHRAVPGDFSKSENWGGLNENIYHAVFDTLHSDDGQHFIDIPIGNGGVMVMHPQHGYVHQSIPVPDGYLSEREAAERISSVPDDIKNQLTNALKEMFGADNVGIVPLGREQNEDDDNERKGETLQ